MKTKVIAAVALMIGVAGATLAQTPSASSTSLSATLHVYVFPTAGQTPSQQSIDEGNCYNWAVQYTGTDPFSLEKQSQQQQQQTQQAQQQARQAGDGAGAVGAVGGAAGGALIGAIAGDAGKGAAIGAATGFLAGRGARRHAKAQATQQVQQQGQQAQQATAQQIEDFKKAFSVCLESNNYMVKF